MAWSTTRIPDQQGKLILITGANSGIGLEAAKILAAKGADVVLACRNATKGQAALDEILAGSPKGKVSVMELDLVK